MRLRFIFPVFLLSISFASAQNTGFEKTYEPAHAQVIAGVVNSGDGYVSAGAYDNAFPFIRKTDADGNFLWEKRFTMPFHTEIYTIISANNGGYLLAGQTSNIIQQPGQRLLLLKTDADGNLEWSKLLNQYSVAVKIEKLPGGYLLGGGQAGDAFGNTDGAISRIDNNGNLIFSRTYGRYQKSVHFTDVVKDSATVYAFGKVSPDNDGVFIATSYNSGFPQYIKKIDLPNLVVSGQLHLLPDHNLLLTGTALTEQLPPSNNIHLPWVKKITPSGDVLWTKYYNCPNATSLVLQRSSLTADGGLLLLVTAIGLEAKAAAGVVRIDPDGNVLWVKYYGDQFPDNLNNAMELPDGSLVLAGTIDLSGTLPGTGHHPYLLHTPANGGLTCCNRSFDIATTSAEEPMLDWFLDDGNFMQEVFPYNLIGVADTALVAGDFCSSQCYHPACDVVLSLGPDIHICKDSTVTFTVGSTFPLVVWQDGSTGYNLIATQPGLYWVETTDSCGTVQRDSVRITIDASTLALACPPSITVIIDTYATDAVVQYPPATAASDCLCSGVDLELNGPISGAVFPIGQTDVCFTATDACENWNSCCFQVDVQAAPPETACDVKETPCIRFELLNIAVHPNGTKTIAIRVINKCNSALKYAAFELPAGFNAVSPANGSVYTSVAGHQYGVKNPNPSPFHSIRFKESGATGISGGLSDIFEYTIPAQSEPDYLLAHASLANGSTYEAHMDTYGCFEPVQNRSSASTQAPSTLVFPNPSTGKIKVDLSAWQGQTVGLQLLNELGETVFEEQVVATDGVTGLNLPDKLGSGLYYLSITQAKGPGTVVKVFLLRQAAK